VEKETESQHTTVPRRKKLNNRDREPDKESQRKKKYRRATGQRGRNETIGIRSRAVREGGRKNSQGQ